MLGNRFGSPHRAPSRDKLQQHLLRSGRSASVQARPLPLPDMPLSASPRAACRTAPLVAATLALGAPTVHAENVVAASGTPALPRLEEVVVTGTRARALEASESPAPIQMVSADALQRAGGKPDLVEELAMLVSSFSAQAWGQDMSNEALLAKLRGLSPNHVLVLVNGKRRHTTANLAVRQNTYQGGAGADLNFIPASAIDHIEVLTRCHRRRSRIRKTNHRSLHAAAGKLLYYKSTIGVTAVTDLGLGYQAGNDLQLSAGATNLFNRYPTQINGTLLAHERAYDPSRRCNCTRRSRPSASTAGTTMPGRATASRL